MRGQAAMEFLLLGALFIGYLHLFVFPYLGMAERMGMDAYRAYLVRKAMDRLEGAIRFVGAGAEGSEEWVVIVLPRGARVYGSGSVMVGEVNVGVEGEWMGGEVNVVCGEGVCRVYREVGFTISGLDLNGGEGGSVYEVMVKNVGGGVVEVR